MIKFLSAIIIMSTMTETSSQTIELALTDDPDSSPQARAERLKRVRNLANLSRKQICDSGININTYTGYEVARYGGLTKWGAEQVIERVAKEGVSVSYNWLMFNIGAGPTVSADYKKILSSQTSDSKVITPDEDEKAIIKELIFFRSLHKHAVEYIVADDAMFPYYLTGEYLAGIKRYGEEINSLIDHDCIVETSDGNTLLRRLHKGSQQNLYTLSCLNPQTTISPPITPDIQLVSASPVLWRRQKNF